MLMFFMPGILPRSPPRPPPPPPRLSIICFMKRNFCTSSVTASGLVPEPFAMRVARSGSRTRVYGSCRSVRVKLLMIASMRTSSRSSRFASAGIIASMPGILPTMSFNDPIFWIVRTCCKKSSRVKFPSSMRIASSAAFF